MQAGAVRLVRALRALQEGHFLSQENSYEQGNAVTCLAQEARGRKPTCVRKFQNQLLAAEKCSESGLGPLRSAMVAIAPEVLGFGQSGWVPPLPRHPGCSFSALHT